MAIKLSPKAVNKAVKALNNGQVVVCPTDTVYGFLADAENKKAVEKIYRIKKRLRKKPLPVFVKDLKMAKDLAEISRAQEAILKKHWPGRYTFILKSQPPNFKGQSGPKFKISKLLIKNGAIALRAPNHKFLLMLLKRIKRPLAQTSVNISGQPPLTKIKDILKLCKSRSTSGVVQLVIDGGDLPKRKPSSIIDLSNNKKIR